MSYNISFFKNLKDLQPRKVFAEDFLLEGARRRLEKPRFPCSQC
jgi:hypothetical protein